MKFVVFLLIVISFCPRAELSEIDVIAWNLTSNSHSPDRFLQHFQKRLNGVGIYGLSGVKTSWTNTVLESISLDENIYYKSIVGRSENSQHLLIAYNPAKYLLMNTGELGSVEEGNNNLLPLYGLFRDKINGWQFYVLLDHARRSQTDVRNELAQFINEWVSNQPYPVIVLSEFGFESAGNINSNYETEFKYFTNGYVMEWIRPEPLVFTRCNSNVINSVFVSGEFRGPKNESFVMFPKGDFCSDKSDKASANRPIRTIIVGPQDQSIVTKRQLEIQIDKVKTELEKLEQLVKDME